MFPIAHLWQTGLTLSSVDGPLGLTLDRFDERVAQPLSELVERDEAVSFFPVGAGFRESSVE